MPQLSQVGEIYASQLFWLAIVFGLIYFGIGKAMVPKIERTIDERNGRIGGDIAAAEAARAAAHDKQQAYQHGLDAARNEAMRTAAEAKAAAAAATEVRIKADDAEAAKRLEAAAARIGKTTGQALQEIEAATVEIVQEIVGKLSGVAVEPATVDRQVKMELARG